MKKELKFFLLTALLGIFVSGFFAGNANALSFGDQIAIERVKDSTFFWSALVTVTPFVEIEGRVTDIDLDAFIPEIAIRFNVEGVFGDASVYNGFRFWDITETVDDFEAVSIWSTNMVGFDASRIAFNDDNIYLDFAGLGFTTSTYVNLQLGDSIVGFSNPSSNSVPEPGTLFLLGGGLLGLAGLGRRKFV